VLVARGGAVAADEGAVHDFAGKHPDRQAALCVEAVDVAVVQQPFGDHLADVDHPGQPGMGFKKVRQGPPGDPRFLVPADLPARFPQDACGFQPCQPDGPFVFVLSQAFHRLDHENHVVFPRKGRKLRSQARHVDQAFLEVHHFPGRHHANPVKDNRDPFPGGDVGIREHAREGLPASGYFRTWLDHILHGNDANAFPGPGQADIHPPDLLVLAKDPRQTLGIDKKAAVLDLGLAAQFHLADANSSQNEIFQGDHLFTRHNGLIC